MPRVEIIEDDCRRAMRRMIGEGRQFQSIVTDPPYHLLSIVKRFGKQGSAPAKFGKDGAFARISKGFNGQTWDGEDGQGRQIAHDPALWRLCHDLLLPGGFMLTFSSPKTGHRMACAIEDAGFVMHPFIGWVYGQGVPKPHAVSPGGEAWAGWYYGEQTLRPALEPVYVAQRPHSGKPYRDSILKNGTGGMNIDACRLFGVPLAASEPRRGAPDGRWPTNIAHDGSPTVLGRFPEGGYFPAFGYSAKAKGAARAGSDHPTIKPVAFLRWLIRLVTPPGGTVLDCFAGSGSTGEAALTEGFSTVLIERDPMYVQDIRRRVGYQRAGAIL
jgi:DNA modification methylase